MKKLILAAAAMMFVAACEDTPPPPAPAPAAMVKQYMVFFDFDRSTITAQAAATIKQAATAAKTAGTTGRTSNECAAEGRRRGIDGEALKTFVEQCTGAVTRIAVTGHTDTSGAAAYNMALSLRRANAVKDALVREGIPAAAIGVTGRGETQLLVQTGDNVREPQNRRVEIVLQ
ncbi:MAG: OmpA family protein [Alphaproteobacteria bacterium]|nr:OmpA family protein [Alphaproteobacteria bacterium]MCW5744409.1 OmpA family protein [Alphaproteobacteria bacterium]